MSSDSAIEQSSPPAEGTPVQVVTDRAIRERDRTRVPPLLRAMRPLQWTKNGLVFAAMIFDRKFTDASSIGLAILAAICFCAASSATYLLNDVRDAERDRIHPKKRFRPIASGELQQRTALIAAGALAIGAIGIGALIRWEFAVVLIGYLTLMVAYNTVLKQLAIIDVFAIGGGFVLRAVGGAVAIDVPISPWLYVCTMLLALFVGFGKRRQELTSLAEDATAHRESLHGYTVALLDQFINILAAATVIAYSMYTFDAAAVPRNHAMMLTIPFVIYAIFRYLLITQKSDLGGAPETLLFADKPLLLSLIGWGFASALIIFITK
ncbi:decaprenyl-phosphate phosphoribosyltransferase [soil metagenome]